MVREDKVKLMSKIAIYEKNKGRTEIPMNSYYKGDYVRLHSLKAAVHATIAFALGAVLVVVYRLEYILTNVMRMDYVRLALGIGILYGLWVFLYWLVARIVYARRYEAARPNIIIYNHHLKKLQETVRKETIKPKGGVVIDDDFIDF
jgi:hypothetical protein